MPDKSGRRSNPARPAIISAAVRKPLCPAKMLIHTAGETTSMNSRSGRRPPSLAAAR
jgi:hypothetical protein